MLDGCATQVARHLAEHPVQDRILHLRAPGRGVKQRFDGLTLVGQGVQLGPVRHQHGTEGAHGAPVGPNRARDVRARLGRGGEHMGLGTHNAGHLPSMLSVFTSDKDFRSPWAGTPAPSSSYATARARRRRLVDIGPLDPQLNAPRCSRAMRGRFAQAGQPGLLRHQGDVFAGGAGGRGGRVPPVRTLTGMRGTTTCSAPMAASSCNAKAKLNLPWPGTCSRFSGIARDDLRK